MVVNSLTFLLFFVVVFTAYYLPVFKKTPKYQNWVLLISSYFFYAYADWRMIPLLFVSTAVFYGLGIWIKKKVDEEKWDAVTRLTVLGVVLGVGVLLYFKYFNFFAESFAQLLSACGFNVSWTALNIIIPVGVSFFTFKLISYVLEISNEAIDPTKDFVEFALYISFFPTIMSGPIDRPNKFIPQLTATRKFDYAMAMDGCRQILWGVFIKMCIADNLAPSTDYIWSNYQNESGSTLLLVALLGYIQLYADFDGYSNMAIGVGKVLNIKVTRNFNHPLLSRNVADFWRRWHMSLTTWITDYVFTPLSYAFRSMGTWGIIIAVMINLFVIGLWHGANWTYILFGVYHGLLFVPLVLSGSFSKGAKLLPNSFGLPRMKDVLQMILTFFIISFGIILFRAESVYEAMGYFTGIFTHSLFSIPSMPMGMSVVLFVFILLVLEWYKRDFEYPLQFSNNTSVLQTRLRYALDYVIILLIVFFGNFESSQFIYFQF